MKEIKNERRKNEVERKQRHQTNPMALLYRYWLPRRIHRSRNN